MKTAGLTSIVLEIRFGKDYPHSPPFIRVIKPRFLPFMMGGGGHVTGGGAMCMELLTNSGWSAASSIEGVLLQVRMAIMNLEPKPARLENTATASHRTYGTGEAMEAFVRACRAHGWEVPKDFKDFGTVAPAGTGSKEPN
jgi:ubiquitin-conjugating enzyme E2 Q